MDNKADWPNDPLYTAPARGEPVAVPREATEAMLAAADALPATKVIDDVLRLHQVRSGELLSALGGEPYLVAVWRAMHAAAPQAVPAADVPPIAFIYPDDLSDLRVSGSAIVYEQRQVARVLPPFPEPTALFAAPQAVPAADVERDAKRYRWLRGLCGAKNDAERHAWDVFLNGASLPEAVDRAIDAALASPPSDKEQT